MSFIFWNFLENAFQIQFLFILDTENIKCLIFTQSCETSHEEEKWTIE